MRERRETSAGFRRVSYHACAGVSLTTSDGKFNLRGEFLYEIVRVTSSAKAFFEVVYVLIEGVS